MGMRNDGGAGTNHGSGDPAAAARWSDPKLAAQALLSPSVPFLADSLGASFNASAASRRVVGNALESAAFAITPEAAARWADPKVAAQALLSGTVPFVADQAVARLQASGHPRDEFPALEGFERAESGPLTAVSPNAVSRWGDLQLAAQLLTSASAGSIADTLLAYARARRLTLEEAAVVLEAWDAVKHPRGANPKNPGWFSPTAGSGHGAVSRVAQAGATASVPPVAAASAALLGMTRVKSLAPSARTSRPARRPGGSPNSAPQPTAQPSQPASPGQARSGSDSGAAAEPPAGSPVPRIMSGLRRAINKVGQILSGPGAFGQQHDDGETGLLQTAVRHLKKLVDAGKITKGQAEALLQELLRLFRDLKPTFRGSPAEQTNQHLALVQRAVASLMTQTLLPGLPPAEQQRIAEAVADGLDKPDYRTFDLDKLVAAVRHKIAAQAAKSSKKPANAPSAVPGKTGGQPGSGVGSEPAGAGQGGRGKGGSGKGGSKIAQDDDDGKRRYRGGRHRDTKLPTGDDLDSHHLPAKSVNGLSEDDGPAIQMDKADHRETTSYGSKARSVEFRAEQAKLIKAGRFGEAIQMEIDDIRAKFGSKYDEAIREMISSLDKWMTTGLKEPH